MEKALQRTLANGFFVGVSSMRSGAMRAVRSRNNRSTEIPLRMALVRGGFSGWKSHDRSTIGRPDFLFQAKKLAVFVDGCFWHGCPKCGHLPRSNTLFWATKIMLNKKRDRNTTRALRTLGYQVLRIWEHEIAFNVEHGLGKIRSALSRAEVPKRGVSRMRQLRPGQHSVSCNGPKQ